MNDKLEWINSDTDKAIVLLVQLNADLNAKNVIRILEAQENYSITVDCWSTYLAILEAIDKRIHEYKYGKKEGE